MVTEITILAIILTVTVVAITMVVILLFIVVILATIMAVLMRNYIDIILLVAFIIFINILYW